MYVLVIIHCVCVSVCAISKHIFRVSVFIYKLLQLRGLRVIVMYFALFIYVYIYMYIRFYIRDTNVQTRLVIQINSLVIC